MQRDRALFSKILSLRSERKSYREIARLLGIAKSTVSYWLSDSAESQAIRVHLSEKSFRESRQGKIGLISKERWQAYRAAAAREAEEEFPQLLNDPLFVAGIMLYWGEGDKIPRGSIRLANTDPHMITVFVKFLRDIMDVPTERIRIKLLLYPDLEDHACRSFWINAARLSWENIGKSTYIQGRHPHKRLPHGVCQILVHDVYHKVKILTWIDNFFKQYTIQ